MTKPDEHIKQNLLEIGTIIADRYKLAQRIGEGGAGTVYRAHDKLLDRTVALKTINRSSLTDDEAVRFHREAKVAASIAHPNVIKMLDFGILDSGHPYMVMEYVNGVSLFRFLKEHGYQSPDFALYLMKQICRGMAAVHATGIVHRDLKASNIMVVDLESNPQIVIIDFGIAKSLDSEGQFTTLTHVGNVVGTPRYMSPEQAMGDKLDQRSDIYSMGCILFELLTNKPLFDGATGIDTINKHVAEAPPSLADAQSESDYPEALEALVSKMVAKSPADRFQNSNELMDAIDDVYATVRSTTVDNDEPEESGAHKVPFQMEDIKEKNSRPFFLGTIALAAILVIGAAVIALNWHLIDSGPTAAEVHKSDKPDLLLINGELNKNFKWTGQGVSRALKTFMKQNKRALGVVISESTLTTSDIERIVRLGSTYVVLENCKFDTTKGLELLAESASINTVGLDFTEGITAQSLRPLKNMRLLTQLSLRGCNLTDAEMKEIGGMRGLLVLIVTDNPKVTTKCLSAFTGRTGMALSMLVHGTGIAKLSEKELIDLAPKYNIVFSKEFYEGSALTPASDDTMNAESTGNLEESAKPEPSRPADDSQVSVPPPSAAASSAVSD